MFGEQNYLVSLVKRFISNEQGAVTIDWVILTAGVVVMGIGAMTVFGAGRGVTVAGMDLNELDDLNLVVAMSLPAVTDQLPIVQRTALQIKAKMIIFKHCLGYGISTDGGQTNGLGNNYC